MKELFAPKKGFISTTFLIVMCSLMSLIAMKSDYIYYANKAYSNLEKSEELFEKEAYIISYVKCALLRKEELDDFYISGTSVCVFNTGRGYSLYFDNHCIDIDVYEDMIVNFEIE